MVIYEYGNDADYLVELLLHEEKVKGSLRKLEMFEVLKMTAVYNQNPKNGKVKQWEKDLLVTVKEKFVHSKPLTLFEKLTLAPKKVLTFFEKLSSRRK